MTDLANPTGDTTKSKLGRSRVQSLAPATETHQISTTVRPVWSWVIGAGVALFPIHNAWLTDHTAVNGEATLFLPALGAVLWILGSLLFIQRYWRQAWASRGSKVVLIPLLVIVGATGLSGLGRD